MYNQCFSCQHNDKTRTISLNCIIIKLNVAAVCILSPKFWQSDSWIRRRCNLRSKHKFLVWKRVLEVTACWNKIFSYLFYNQTDKNGACICKKWVKLSKFIYEVLKLALCANLNKWYWSHFVIFSFQPIFSPPWPEDSPEESESIVGKEKQKVKVLSDEAKVKGHLQLQEDIFIQLEPFQEAAEMIQVLLLLPQWTAKLHLALLDLNT